MPEVYFVRIDEAISSARPLIFANEGEPDYPISVGATAFLMRFRGLPYVVTTEHGLTAQRRDLHEVRIGITADSLEWLPLRDVYGIPYGNQVQQALDFLIYSVDEAELAASGRQLPRLVEPTFDQVGEISETEGQYLLVGFPSRAKGIDYPEKRVRLRREVLTGSYDHWDEQTGCHRLRLDPAPDAMGAINGMSGSPVFARAPQAFCSDLLRLVGVAVTGSIESKSVRFIDINRVLEFMNCVVPNCG